MSLFSAQSQQSTPRPVPYVVGTHPNSPSNPHSALPTGYNPPSGDYSAPDDLDAVPARAALEMCKMVERRMWSSMTPLRQFKGLQADVIRKAEGKQFVSISLFLVRSENMY